MFGFQTFTVINNFVVVCCVAEIVRVPERNRPRRAEGVGPAARLLEEGQGRLSRLDGGPRTSVSQISQASIAIGCGMSAQHFVIFGQ